MLTLHDHQAEAIVELREALKKYRSVLLRCPTGWGKSFAAAHMLASACDKGKRALFTVHRRELIDQTADLFDEIGLRYGIISSGYPANPLPMVQIGSIDTLRGRLEKINKVDLLIVDECFPPNTMVDGTKIEEIKIGDSVRSYNHSSESIELMKVLGVIKREYGGDWYKIIDGHGKSFVCTENHPVFIENTGYVSAKHLTQHVGSVMVTIHEMSKLQKIFHKTIKAQKTSVQVLRVSLFCIIQETCTFFTSFGRFAVFYLWGKNCLCEQESLSSSEKKRKSILPRAVQNTIYERNFFSNDEKDKRKIWETFWKNVIKKNVKNDIYWSWRKWTKYKTTNSSAQNFWTTHGIPNFFKKSSRTFRMCSKMLQSRFGSSRNKTFNRSGRQNTQVKEMEIFRQKENGNIKFSRLEGVEVYKRGSGWRPFWVPSKNTVYNIHVAENNNYFANGILVHNCVHAAAKTWLKVINYFPEAKVVGLTATPHRTSGEGLGHIFQHMVHGKDVPWLIENKFLSPFRAFVPSIPDLSNVHTKMGDYIQSETEEIMDKPTITGDAIKHYLRLCNGGKAVIFAVSVKHSKHIAAAFCEAGIAAIHIDGETPKEERKMALRNFRDDKIKILCNVNIVSEGLSIPDMDAVIMMRPTQSLSLHLQQIGRAIRYKEGKTALIIDHCNNLSRHGLPTDNFEWTLEGKKKKSKSEKSEVPVRICPQCFCAHSPAMKECSECGFKYEVKNKLPEIVDGDLAEIDLNNWRKNAPYKQVVQKARTREELVAVARARGYKRGWVGFIMKERANNERIGRNATDPDRGVEER